MKPEKIIRGNKLIAEFITDEPEVLKRDLKKAGTLESMQYHSSWDWLMPVVEKIAEITFDGIKSEYAPYTEHPFHVDLNRKYAKITVDNDFRLDNIHKDGIVFNVYRENTTIIACFKAVVEFIKWYNLKIY